MLLLEFLSPCILGVKERGPETTDHAMKGRLGLAMEQNRTKDWRQDNIDMRCNVFDYNSTTQRRTLHHFKYHVSVND